MLRKLPLFTLLILLIAGCSQTTANQFKEKTKNDKNSFFPVTQYLLGQIKILDTLPVTPLKITTVNGKADSSWIKREEIKLYTKPFITPVIDSVSCSRYFIESSFLDQTINAFTFSYDAVKQLPDSLTLRRWDIYIDPQSNKVKRIYIVKQLNSIPAKTLQLTWRSEYGCKITTITNLGNAAQQVKEQELIWNFNE